MPLRIFGNSGLRFPVMALAFFPSVMARTSATRSLWLPVSQSDVT